MNDKSLSNLEFEPRFYLSISLLPEQCSETVFPANKPKQETEAEAKKLLDFLGLSHRLNHKPNFSLRGTTASRSGTCAN
jgi:lipoprotein-releasing system ATP-binding protein